MSEKQNKLTIGFNYENEFGDKFSSTSSSEVFECLGDTEIDFIGRQLNNFLRQCGYYRKNDYIFMEDVNEEELESLTDFLATLRKQTKDTYNPLGDNE